MLKGKSVIVTGSTSGIGYGVAQAFVEAGASVVVNGRKLNDEAQTALDALQAIGGDRVVFGAADVAVPADWTALVETATQAFGKVDILVNNAGIQHTSPVHTFPKEKWDQILAVNLSSVFHGAQAVLPAMLARGTGRIINIASVHGLVASVDKAAYVAAKHGVIGLTKVIALETAKTDVTCNSICPGWVLTPLVAAQIEARAQKNGTTFDIEKAALLEEKQPSGEFATPAQIGALAVFLSTDSAAQITGQAMPVDGGWVAR